MTKAAKIMRCKQRMAQFRQNWLFKSHQEQFYQEINGDLGKDYNAVPNAEESKKFWNIWSVGAGHKENAEWLNGIKNNININGQERMTITEKMFRNKRSKERSKNRKVTRRDGVQIFSINKLVQLHGRISKQLSDILNL